MARTVADINTQITTQLVANYAAIGITIDPTQWSKRNIMRLFCYAFATCCAFLEQLMDTLKTSIDTTASQSSAASNLWIQAKMFAFQYSATSPQVLQLINTVPAYPVINAALCIITACSVTTTNNNQVTIKVATGNPFVALDPVYQLPSAQGYINTIGTAGINYTVVSANSDKLYINANIYFLGQYAAVIQASVIAALELFLQNLSITNFNGAIKMTDIENTILAVPGVTDVVLLNVRGRADGDAFTAGINLVQNSTILLRLWNTISGYVSPETTAGYTFANSLNFIAE